MSSNPPTKIHWQPRRWSLRTRLITMLVGLLALVCLTVGLVTATTLRSFLYDRLDHQVLATQQLMENPPPDSPEADPFPLGTPIGAVALVVNNGNGVGKIFDPSLNRSNDPKAKYALSPGAINALMTLPTDNRGHNRNLGVATNGFNETVRLGDYRMIANNWPGHGTLIVGLPLREVNETVVRYSVAIALVSTSALLIAGTLGAAIIRRTLAPLRRVAATATRVSQLPLSRGELPELALTERVPERDTDPRTEVGQVGGALNHLLGHVTTALSARQANEERMRQFLADASHELRTPLASIRGYAELTRRVPEPLPEAVSHAVGRVESEATRMGTLVDDLLLLARLDSGRPLDSGEVDLSVLVIDAVSDARAAGPKHHWRLQLPDESVVVPGDSARLHQVLANLLANARVHTPAGTTVELALRPDTDAVRIVVRDDGPGIPPALLPDIFDRFTRADTSRSRAAGSSGLGLSIVSAVVQAHGGTVDVQSIPGCTEFTVTLPRATQEAHIPFKVSD
jgi:two-component system OmpR family sensor kinase